MGPPIRGTRHEPASHTTHRDGWMVDMLVLNDGTCGTSCCGFALVCCPLLPIARVVARLACTVEALEAGVAQASA